MSERLDSQQWSVFWQKGTPTTFLGRFHNNYDGEIAAFWEDQFAAMPSDAHVLDLATGNGALALLAAGYAETHQNQFRVTGIDYAEIDPAGKVLPEQPEAIINRIKFHSHRTMEATELPDNSVDAAISQFGFEYADTTRAIPEVSRVLKPDARFVILMHRENSFIHQQSVEGLREVGYCLKSPLHKRVESLLRRLTALKKKGKDPAKDKQAEKLRADVNDATEALHQRMEEFSNPSHLSFFLTNTMAVFRPQLAGYSFHQKMEQLRFVQEETMAFEMRMKDLLSAVRSEAQIEQMTTLLAAEGFEISTSEPVTLDEGVFCHKLVAIRQTT